MIDCTSRAQFPSRPKRGGPFIARVQKKALMQCAMALATTGGGTAGKYGWNIMENGAVWRAAPCMPCGGKGTGQGHARTSPLPPHPSHKDLTGVPGGDLTDPAHMLHQEMLPLYNKLCPLTLIILCPITNLPYFYRPTKVEHM